MHALVARKRFWLMIPLMTLGCGGTKPPGTVQSVPAPVSAVPAQNQTANAAPAAKATSTAKSTPKATSKAGPVAEKKSLLPANADPRTVFTLSGTAQPMEVERTKGKLASDQFEVATADLSSDSTKFIVESTKSAGSSNSTQPLIGQGQPKAGFTLPKGFTPVKEVGYSSDGLPLRIICSKTGTTLALVSGGPAIVGTEVGAEESKPSFTVNLDTFYMEILEVTVLDYEKYRTELREKKKSVPPAGSNPSADPKTPVLGISWAMAQNYARWANLELPTESEWEKAARGPNGLRTPWGDGKALWTTRSMTVTGAYPTDSSPYGILDLAGNAKEWCTDLFSSAGHVEAAAAAEKDALHNWPGPKKVKDMNLRTVKGNGRDYNSWYREGKDMGKSHFDVGFRCVLRIPPEPKPAATAATS